MNLIICNISNILKFDKITNQCERSLNRFLPSYNCLYRSRSYTSGHGGILQYD